MTGGREISQLERRGDFKRREEISKVTERRLGRGEKILQWERGGDSNETKKNIFAKEEKNFRRKFWEESNFEPKNTTYSEHLRF